EVVESLRDPPQVADPVAVRILERARVDLVDDGVPPPHGRAQDRAKAPTWRRRPKRLCGLCPHSRLTHRLGSPSFAASCGRASKIAAAMPTEAGKIRNVAVAGHRGTGKTSLVEAMLFQAGAINRLGSVEQGSTTSDWDEDEQRRQMSL